MKKILSTFVLALGLLNVTYAQESKKEKELTPGIYAKIQTNKGNILLQLEAEKTPMTVANFVALAEGKLEYKDKKIEKPFYNGLKFHRVIKDFMIQGGCPLGNGSGDPGYKFADEIHPDLKHTSAGILSMANSGPATNGSQFFITHKETPWLDGKHTVFGHVIEGQDVVNAIAQNDTLKTVTILRIGKDYKKWNAQAVFLEKTAALDKIEADKKAKIEKIASMPQEEYKKFLLDDIKKKYPTAQLSNSGLIHIIENKGTGETAKQGAKMAVHYVGTFTDGTKFDSSKDRGVPMEFQYQVQRMVPGFEEAIGMLAQGGKGTFILPYFLAYGPTARGPIPAYADLIFEVEVVSLNNNPTNEQTAPAHQHNEHDGHNH